MTAKRIHIPTAREKGEMTTGADGRANGFKDSNVVYIGRKPGYGPNFTYDLPESPFHNPFLVDTTKGKKDGTREEVVAKFTRYILEGGVADYKGNVHDGRHLLERLGELEGKTLACWCGPDEACHGDVLMALFGTCYDPDFWAERGINSKVRERRGYKRWNPSDLTPVTKGFEGLNDDSIEWLSGRAQASGTGLVIPRFPPSGEYPDIFPEIRPDRPVPIRYTKHYHGSADYEGPSGRPMHVYYAKGIEYSNKLDGDDLYRWFIHKPEHMLDHRWKWHTEPYGVMTDEQRAAKKRGEEPGNDEETHVHVHEPKYLFPPSPKIETAPFQSHADLDDEDYERHIKNKHKFRPTKKLRVNRANLAERDRLLHTLLEYGSYFDSDEQAEYLDAWQAAPKMKEREEVLNAVARRVEKVRHRETLEAYKVIHHPRKKRDKDKERNFAERIDVHPMARDRLLKAERFFFGIEGCLKADAILSKILQEGRPEGVFSVPAVSQWNVPEFNDFIRRYLKGKVVYIVPDADWFIKGEVIAQARFCQTYLEHKGVIAFVVAPPTNRLDEGIKGVDDFLGIGGGTLDELEVVERIVPEDALMDALHRLPGKIDVIRSYLYMLEFIAEHAAISDDPDEDGTLSATYETMGRLMCGRGMRIKNPGKRAKRALKRLEEYQLVKVQEGTLELEEEHWTPQRGAKVMVPEHSRLVEDGLVWRQSGGKLRQVKRKKWILGKQKATRLVEKKVNKGYYRIFDEWADPPTFQITKKLRGKDERTPLGNFDPITRHWPRRMRHHYTEPLVYGT